MDNSFLHRKKLLLVDDELDLLKMVTDILKDAGFETVLTAASVKEAVMVAKQEKPDLMILDVMLPDGDGFSLMEQLRTFTDVPVIFLTAKDEAADKLAGLGLGADDYISKPFMPQELLLRIYAVLRRTYKEDSPLVVLDGCTIDFIINDRVDIAMAVQADGVHIGQHDIPAAAVRKMIGKDMLLGVSVSTVEQAIKAQQDDADYLGVGAMFPTGTKTDADFVSMEKLKEIRTAVSLPIVVIGGINKDNAHCFKTAGIDGLAVVSVILAKPNIKVAAEELKAIFSGKESKNGF